jgi:UDP-N-acetylmuramoyl-tripeptide--D-alanyl-D-alanine ligase
MIPLTAEEAAVALETSPLLTGVRGVSIDSRAIRAGDLFLALRGERFDGHDYVADALAAGAVGAVVDSSWWDGGKSPAAESMSPLARSVVYPVADTLQALGRLANAVRRKSEATVIAVTGSVGKTGTKDILSVMAARVGRVVATPANENNEIGVPLTLLSVEPGTRTVIVEMGMRGKGQIASLARIAEPDVGVITNIHPVHLELLGSLENVAEAKAEMLAGLRPDGIGVVPAGCAVLEQHVAVAERRLVRFGLAEDRDCADVWGEYRRHVGGARAGLIVHWPGGQARMEAPFGARSKMENAVAAAAACYAAGLPMDECLQGLEEAAFTPSRGDLERVGDWLIINDTYNASPAAVRASLDELVRIAADEGGRPVAVLGDMLELGPETRVYHEETGVYAAGKGVRVLWGVGPLSRATAEGFRHSWEARSSGLESGAQPARAEQTWIVGHVDASSDFSPVLETLQPRDVILFKASRSLKLEIMVELLRKAAPEQGSGRGSADESCGGVTARVAELGGSEA